MPPILAPCVSSRRNAALLAEMVVWAYVIGLVAIRGVDYQRDFQVYYHAAKAWKLGHSPYEAKTTFALSGGGARTPFVYPAVTLQFFSVFALVPYVVAQHLWLAVKVACLAGLLLLWRRTFLKGIDLLFLLFYCLLAFNTTIFKDLVAGNISILEELLLWAGFWFYIRGRPAVFAAFIVLGSVFKLTPIVLLGLLVIDREYRKRAPLVLACGLASFAILIFGPMLPHPDWLQTAYGSALREPLQFGRYNPCALAFILEFSGKDVVAPIFGRWPSLIGLLWAGYLLVILGLSWGPIVAAVRRNNRIALLTLAILVYALAMPRMKDYSYILLIVPSILVLFRLPASGPIFVPAVISICLPMYLVGEYFPWIVAIGIWFVTVSGIVPLEEGPNVSFSALALPAEETRRAPLRSDRNATEPHRG